MTMPRRNLVRLQLAAAALVFALVASPALAQTADDIAAVQQWLNDQGYDAGPADGMMGQRTRSAIAAWESEHGREATGELSGWIVDMAVSGGDGSAAPAGEDGTADGTIAVPEGETTIAALDGDIMAFSGTGGLEFSEREDGTILITDGLAWRPGIAMAPRILEITDTEFGIFSTSAESLVPVPLDDSVVDVPGSAFVPLFLALDREAAARSSLADAAGITWTFRQGGLHFALDGFMLTAEAPGASIAFGADGVVLSGFTLAPL